MPLYFYKGGQMYTNNTITVFNFENNKYTAMDVGRVFLDYVEQANIKATGMTNVDTVKVLIPNVDLNIKKNGKSFIAIGQGYSDIVGLTPQELSANLKTFKESNETYIITKLDKRKNGTPRMWHIDMGCK